MVTLRPVKEAEFEPYMGRSVRDFAVARVEVGNWNPDQATEKTRHP